MKLHHEFIHARNTVKNFNLIVTMIEWIRAYMINEDIDGNSLGETLENLKALILDMCSGMIGSYGKIEKFLNGFDSYDLLQWTNKSRQNILGDRIISDTLSANISTAVQSVSINKLDKLAALASQYLNPLDYATPIQLPTEYHYTIILNDMLDASYYLASGIDPNNGEPTNKTEEQIRNSIKGWMNQFKNFTGYGYSNELQTEINMMVGIRDQVITLADNGDLAVIADLINNNIDKLPLMRRLWAVS